MRMLFVVLVLAGCPSLASRNPGAPQPIRTRCHTDAASPVYGNTFTETRCETTVPQQPQQPQQDGWWCSTNQTGLGFCGEKRELCEDTVDRIIEDCQRGTETTLCDQHFSRCHHERSAYCAWSGCFTTLAWCQKFEQLKHRDGSGCFAR